MQHLKRAANDPKTHIFNGFYVFFIFFKFLNFQLFFFFEDFCGLNFEIFQNYESAQFERWFGSSF